ncbi:MAG: hypothetical protein JW809_16255 [Pirellulales bacterium]|nr:hypothetical protein [Pirellulales bacterium]
MSNQLPSKPPRVRFQFTITSLLALAVAVWSGVVLAAEWPAILLVVVPLAFSAFFEVLSRVSRTLTGCFCVFAVGAFWFAVLAILPVAALGREAIPTLNRPLTPAGRCVAGAALVLSTAVVVVSLWRHRHAQMGPPKLPLDADNTRRKTSDFTRTAPPADT